MGASQHSTESGGRRLADTFGALVIVAILLMAASFAFVAYFSRFDAEYLARSEQVRVLTQRIGKAAPEAAEGNADAFPLLRETAATVARDIQVLQEGNPDTGLPPTETISASAQAALRNVIQPWERMRADVEAILARQEAVLAVHRGHMEVPGAIESLEELAHGAAERLVSVAAPREQILQTATLAQLAERMAAGVTGMHVGSQATGDNAAEHLASGAEDFGRLLVQLQGTVGDPQAAAALQEAEALFAGVSQEAETLLQRQGDLTLVRQAANDVFGTSEQILAASGELVQAYRNLSEQRPIQPWLGYVFGALALAFMLIRGLYSRRAAQADLAAKEAEARRADEVSRKNQEAILNLLDEIEGLKEGDLTVQASVGEEITGAIGDAFNDAIEALRNLVMTINETSVQVSSAAQQTQATAMHLAEASDHQAHQITAASAAVNEMAVSIDHVSRNAQESAEVAQQAVEISTKGAATVKRTIEQMDAIREQIQETSKRIKRLGESSQEIGNIVELINDIADQTNILALNASIQAAMAGESGRGFAVVADEVQRLAERSGNATKQIEALVRTIQTDTNEAVISMEQSTSGVVAGARQAEDAGDALREIEGVSKHLAGLIQNISEAARQQATAAANISDTMNVIQEITSQTSAGTNETATSIGNLADLANELRNSVAGFKLPE